MRRLLLPLVVLFTLFPLGFAGLYTRTYFADRAGKDLDAQRASLKGVPWFKAEYRQLVRRLKLRLSPDDALFVEPQRIADDEPNPGGRTRWFLYLANDLYPIRVFVRAPKWASGTLVDYPRWMDLHFEDLDVDGSGLGFAGILKREELEAEGDAAIDERGIQWKLTYPIAQHFRIKDLKLYERDPDAEGGWRERDLKAFLDEASGAKQAREAGK